MDEPLSGDQILEAIPNAKIIPYDVIMEYNSLNKLLPDERPIFMLYDQLHQNSEYLYGHWVLLYRYNNEIHFFDSYGGAPDSQDKRFPFLTYLLLTSDDPINFNEFQFQGEDTQVCGRYCILRYLFKQLNIYDFKKMLDNLRGKQSYDEIVYKITNSII